MKEVLAYSFNKLRWYQDRFGHDFLQKLSQSSFEEVLRGIPILTKKNLQTFSRWLKVWVPGSSVSDYQVSSTSGSTGQPVQVLKYMPEYFSRHMAVRLLDADWQGTDLSKGFLSLSQTRSSGLFQNYGEPYDFLGSTGPLRVVNTSNLSAREILFAVAEADASNLSINGVLLRAIANEQLLDPSLSIKLETILSFADPVDEDLRRLVKKAFGAKVSNRYSADELGFLGIQCSEHDHLHALQFHNYVEIINENGKSCAPGEVGRVVVTGLTNPGMPLVRYELGDLAKWGEACPSGMSLPVLDPVITRERDLLIDGEGRPFVPTTGKAKFLKFAEVTDFQMYLFEDAIAIVLETRAELSESQLTQIEVDVQKIFRSSLPVTIKTTPSLQWLGHWKRRVFYKLESPIPPNLKLENLVKISQLIKPTY